METRQKMESLANLFLVFIIIQEARHMSSADRYLDIQWIGYPHQTSFFLLTFPQTFLFIYYLFIYLY